MATIVGVRFHQAGKIYYFEPDGWELTAGTHVIVETARGIEMGTVLIPQREVPQEQVTQPLRPILRAATEDDERIVSDNQARAKEAMKVCREKIAAHGLSMKLVGAEYTFDRNKLLFYFTADGRVDFRELVKDLAAIFRTRIELRQIGVRDETKLLSGIGICGRPLCCATYLCDFAPVSIKMAKEQGLSLNPTKISGMCGRLMCCLKNEQDTYEYLQELLPDVGDTVTADDGTTGEVSSVSIMRQTVKILVEEGDEKQLKEYPVSHLTAGRQKKKDETPEKEGKRPASPEEGDGTDAREAGPDATERTAQQKPRSRKKKYYGKNTHAAGSK